MIELVGGLTALELGASLVDRVAQSLEQPPVVRHYEDVRPSRAGQGFERGVQRLIGIAHRQLRNALAYSLLIPKQETGIRYFCLWATGLAVLTLRKINNHLDYTDGNQVKISRLSLKGTILATQLARQNDTLLKLLFYLAAWPLPLMAQPTGLPSQGISAGKANQAL